jgi:hypothetical protein
MKTSFSLQSIALMNYSQVTQGDIDMLLARKPHQGKGLTYATGLWEWGCIVLISEEEDLRRSDFADCSLQMQQAVEGAYQQGAAYLLLSPDCEEVKLSVRPALAHSCV